MAVKRPAADAHVSKSRSAHAVPALGMLNPLTLPNQQPSSPEMADRTRAVALKAGLLQQTLKFTRQLDRQEAEVEGERAKLQAYHRAIEVRFVIKHVDTNEFSLWLVRGVMTEFRQFSLLTAACLFTDVQSKSNTLAHLTEQLNRLQETLEIKRRIPAQRQNESDLAVSELKLAKAEKELQQVRVLE